MTKLLAPVFVRHNGETKQILSLTLDTDVMELRGVMSGVVKRVDVNEVNLAKISSDVTEFSPSNTLTALATLYNSMGEENRHKVNTYFIEKEPVTV